MSQTSGLSRKRRSNGNATPKQGVAADNSARSWPPTMEPRPSHSKNSAVGLESLSDSIKYFEDKFSDTKMRGNVKQQMAMSTIQTTAKAEGLSNDNISCLLDVASSARFPDSINSKLIKLLLPNERLSQQVIMNCISWICTNRPSPEIQALLCRWMVLVFDVVDGKDKLHALYGIIFNLIESDLLCPHICHLLYLLTRKQDVMPFRVRKLLNLQKRAGSHPHITGLLSIYKLYRPSWLSVIIPSSKRVYFKQTARVWAGDMKIAKERIYKKEKTTQSQVFDVNTTITDFKQKSKRRRREIIPGLKSSSWSEEHISYNLFVSDSVKVPISHIQTFDELLVNLDRLELPSQIAAVLKSPLLQHAVSCTRDENVIQRLSFWLYQTLHEELLDCDDAGNNPRAENLLQLLINFTEFLQEDVPVSEIFLVKYLYTWNGLDYRPYILRLITRFRIHPFQKLNDLVLEPLRKLFFCSSVFFKCQLIYTLTELLRHYLEVELPKHRASYTRRKVDEDEDVMDDLMNCESLFEEVLDPELAEDTIQNLVSFVDDINCIGLQQENDHALLLYHVMSFYELVSVMFRTYCLPFISIPRPGIIYRSLLSNNAIAICRICKVVCNYKEEFSRMKKADDISLKVNLKEGIRTLNQYIIDISNALWRDMAFQTTAKTMVFNIPMEILEQSNVYHINLIFSIQHHIALTGYAYKFLEETQSDDNHHPRQIQGNTRNAYLQFLSNDGLNGIVMFINTFIKRVGSSSQ